MERKKEAVQLLEQAFMLDETDARILMELDQLYKRMDYSPKERLHLLNKHKEIIATRDDLYLEYATLLNLTGEYEQAMQLIDQRQFHPWEGGEGKVPAQYQYARIQLAKKSLKAGEYEHALALIEECFVYPHHLGEGKLYGAQENDFLYYKGCILEAMGNHDEAHSSFTKAASGNGQPTAAMYYNDQKPDKIYYQGLALRKVGKEAEARGRFNSLISYGEKHLYDTFVMDYFAVSLPDLQIWEDDMNKKNRIHCHYLMGLGHLGLGNKEKADKCFSYIKEINPNFQIWI